MTLPIEKNTQAILLLTSPLLTGARGGEPDAEPLSLGEYNELARALREHKHSPSDLLSQDASELVANCRVSVDGARVERLLGRGFALAQAIEAWRARSIWVVSRAEPSYPRRLRARFKESAPPLLYGCGDLSLCDVASLAIVGSRDATDEQIQFARDAAKSAAEFGCGVVSGGARGIDQTAMTAALDAGGTVVGMLADGLARAAVDRLNREALRSGRLILLSVSDPNAGFHTGLAMQRNRLIYGLADAGLVVNAEFEKGGTWAGAIEQLTKFRFVPIYVRARGELGKGMIALRERGAQAWPQPQIAEDFERALAAQPMSAPSQPQLPFGSSNGSSVVREVLSAELPVQAVPPVHGPSLAEELFDAVRKLVRSIAEPITEVQFAEMLGVSKAQAKDWIVRLVSEGRLEKTKRPVRYRIVRTVPAAGRDE